MNAVYWLILALAGICLFLAIAENRQRINAENEAMKLENELIRMQQSLLDAYQHIDELERSKQAENDRRKKVILCNHPCKRKVR